jgi:multiple sugar transport system substrate-binding protein
MTTTMERRISFGERDMRRIALLSLALLVAGCGDHTNGKSGGVTEITVQRFFGVCDTEYGGQTDVSKAEGECGIITTLLNKFNAENRDIHAKVNTVEWPGYDQLNAQLASGDAPDVVVMHQSVISDYQARGLLLPLTNGLAAEGIHAPDFTAAARAGVTRDGQIYGLPFDTWAPLWHINMNEFRKAGLVKDGKPILPASPEELIAQAKQFTKATGKPYFVQALSNETAAYTRNLYTYLMQQNSVFFADPHKIKLQTPEAKRVVELFKDIYDNGLTTKNQDYPAATAGFIKGEGGVYIVGTWLIGDFEAESKKANVPLSGGYMVVTMPQLFTGRDATYADGHSWVVPKKDRTDAQTKAVYRLLKFLANHDFDWSRTGHLPAFKAVIESDAYRTLPQRANIAKLATTGMALPPSIRRQAAIQDIIGEEMAAAITGQKPVDRALADAQSRVNELLANL